MWDALFVVGNGDGYRVELLLSVLIQKSWALSMGFDIEARAACARGGGLMGSGHERTGFLKPRREVCNSIFENSLA
jgi:hypothetical protein